MGNGNSDPGTGVANRARGSTKPIYLLLVLVALILAVFGILHVFGLNIGVQI